jgi:hypothetical protein
MKKGLIFILFLALIMPVSIYGKTIACDFDGDEIVTSSDIAIFAAWIQSRKSTDVSFVQGLARGFVSGITITRLPTDTDKLEDSSAAIGTTDLGLLAAYIQSRKSSDFSFVESVANSIMSKVVSLSKLPGTEIGDSTVPITITGITTD